MELSLNPGDASTIRSVGQNRRMAGAFQVRRAVAADAEGIAVVMHAVVAERVHSAIDRAWSADEERRYLESLSGREAFHVAIGDSGQIVGCQSLELYSTVLTTMSHVAQVGTFVLPSWRGHGGGLPGPAHTVESLGRVKAGFPAKRRQAGAVSPRRCSPMPWTIRSPIIANGTVAKSWRRVNDSFGRAE